MRQFGLAAWISFQDKGAAAGMGRIGAAADKLKKKFAGLKAGAQQFGRGIGQLAIGMAPLTLGLGAVIKMGARFEQSIANLRSKMLSKFDPALKTLAKTLGATTKFSASEAADAMTELAKAGFGVRKIIGAVPGVLAAAAAENIPLAQAASITADTLNQFGINAKQAKAASNTLALASATANTSMVGLAEGLKLAAPAVRSVGGNFTDTTAILSALADVGLKGTLAGTSLRGAIGNLVDPGKKASKALARLGFGVGKVRKLIRAGKIGDLIQAVAGRLGDLKDNALRGQLALRIFGKRALPLAVAISKNDKNADKFSKSMARLRKEFNSGGSAAEKMAKIQLQTLGGQLTLLKSASEGVAIELFGMISKQTSGAVQSFTKRVGQLAEALQIVNQPGGLVDPKNQKKLRELPGIIVDIAVGIKEGFAGVKAVFSAIGRTVVKVGKMIGLEIGGKGAQSTAKMVTKFVVLGAAIAPIGAALLVVTKIASGLFNVVAGGVKMAVGAGRLLAGAGKGLGGILSKIPILGKVMPKLGGALGKVGGALDSLTAMPVRVTNFSDMALAGAAGNALGLGAQAGQTAGLLTRMRLALGGFASKIPLVGGALTSSFGAVGAASTSLVGKLAAKGGFIAAIGAAGFAGWKFGKFLDQKFGISGKLANWMDRVLPRFLGGQNQADSKRRVAEHANRGAVDRAQAMANQLVRFARTRGTAQLQAGGPQVKLTRAVIEGKLSEFLRKQNFSQTQINATLTRMEATFRGIPKPKPSAGGPKAPVKALKPAKDAIALSGGLVPVSAGDVVLDRASLAAAVTSQLRGGLAGRAGAGLLGGGDPGQTTPPQARGAGGGGMMTVQVPVSIDGRQIALAVAEVRLDDIERSGGRLEPGDRSSLLTRGFLGGDRG